MVWKRVRGALAATQQCRPGLPVSSAASPTPSTARDSAVVRGLEADAVGQVRVESADPALVESLTGQQQMHSQGAAEPSDGTEQLHEVRMVLQQLGELVDHHEQRGQGGQGRVGAASLPVGAHARRPGAAQEILTPVEFTAQGVLHPGHQVRLVGQVGDDRGDMVQGSRPRNVAPPLKSISTRLGSSGGWRAAIPSTTVRNSSDFPEPVAPTHSPCGPSPPSAASLMSSSTEPALGVGPDRHPEPVPVTVRRPRPVPSGSAMPNSAHHRCAGSDAARRPGCRCRASRRAQMTASANASRSAVPIDSSPDSVRTVSRSPSSRSRSAPRVRGRINRQQRHPATPASMTEPRVPRHRR